MAKLFVYSVFMLICSASSGLPKVEDENDSDHTKDSTIRINNDTLILHCDFDIITNIVTPWDTTLFVKEIYLFDCHLPKLPLVEVFKDLNINNEAIESLHYINIAQNDFYGTIETLPPANYMENLSISSLEIASHYKDFLLGNPGFFRPLLNLRNLTVWGIELPKLASSLPLQILSLENAILKEYYDCSSLRKLRLKRMTEESISEAWLSNCTGLIELKTEDMTEKAVFVVAKVKSSNLRVLSLRSSQLDTLPFDLLKKSTGLTHMDLSNNNLQDKTFLRFPVFHNLVSLDLSDNKLTGWFLVDLVSKLPAIQNLTLDGNRFFHSFRNFQIKVAVTRLFSLKRLSMNRMLLDPDCLMSTQFSTLQYLSLTSNDSISNLMLQSLPGTNASYLEVDLRGRPVKTVSLSLADYQIGPDPSKNWPAVTNLTIQLSYIDCDCNNADLARILNHYPQYVSMPNLRCNRENGRQINQEPLDNLNCTKEKIGGCVKRTWDHKSVVDCSNMMSTEFEWSKMINYGVRGVNVSGNRLTTLRGIDFGWLQWVDLRNNRLSRLENSELAQLFALRSRRVWLSGNMFICDCNNRALLRAIHTYYSQVMDYDTLICVDSGESLSFVSVFEVCQIGKGIFWGVCCFGSLFTVITMFVLRRYGSWLRTYFYARGYCLSCLSEKDPDADRPYDAFISFAHGDDAFVIEHLLPRLELTPQPFRVCVHYRDWVVGDWIPAQIMRSVQLSKRTIIVLSRHLIKSWWGVLEFRYAHAHAMAEGHSRLLVLVLDDVLDEKLEPELQGYLANNTFLKLDDPWFWDKLHYAMSHNNFRYY